MNPHFFRFLFVVCLVTTTPIIAQNINKALLQLSYEELDSLMYIEYNKGTFDKAIPYVQAGREKAKLEFGDQDSIFAEYTNNLGFFHTQIGQYQQAEQLYLQVITIQKKVLGEQHPDYATSLSTLASLYESMNNYEKAESWYLQVIETQKKALGEQHPDYATSLTNLALLYYYIDDYAKSEPLYLQALDIQKHTLGVQHFDYTVSLNNLASLYESMGNYTKAESLYLQVLATRKKILGEQDSDYATSLNNLGLLYYNIDNYDKAEPLYLQALAIRRAVLGEQHPYYATSLNNLAVLYQNMGNYEKAEPLHLQNLAIEKKTLGEWDPSYASSLNNLGNLYKHMGSYAKSELLFLQALEIQKKTLGEQHSEYAISLHNLAYLYEQMGDYAKAEPLFLKALIIEKKNLGGRHPLYAKSLNNVGNLYKSMGKLDTAFYYCQLSIVANAPTMDSSFANWGNLDNFNYTSTTQINRSIHTLLSIFQKQYDKNKDPKKLESHYVIAQAAIRLNERIRNKFTGEGDKLRTLVANNDFVLAAIKTGVALGKPDYETTSFDFAEMNKGVLLLEAAQTANAQQFGDLPDTLVLQEQKLQKKQSSLTAKLAEKRSEIEKDSLRGVLNGINQEVDVFTNMLKNKFPKYAALKYGNKTATAKDVQALLDDKTALLEYLIGDSVIYIFYVDKKQVKLTPIYLSNKILNEKIKDFHSTLSNYQLVLNNPILSYQKYTENAYWFYENLIPFALKDKTTQNIQKLIIVADGELGHLPFETFLTKPAPQKITNYTNLNYLFKDYKISYNYSATIWKSQIHGSKSNKETVKKTNNGQLLAMASNYSLKIDSSNIGWRLASEQRIRASLQPLPAAHKEIESLTEKFNGFFAFDKEASEKNFKEKAGDYAIIHLAMHGLLDDKAPILSSLIFTEDSDSLENNFLHAYEISKMKLNADLVVLSACETGYGRFEKGNGIASLAQAFTYAGAPAMIVSLWQVNDFATSEIMKVLYQNLANGMEKDEALQQAKLAYINNAVGIAAHPAFWSPFVQMGNTDAIYLETKGGFGGWILGIGAVVLLAAGFWGMQRKK